jgi:GTPase KRas
MSSYSSQYSGIFNIAIVGSGCVGKSSLTIQFIHHYFQNDYDPTIEDSYRIQCVVDGQSYLLEILDTAGQDEYVALRDQYMRNGDGFLCIYAITSTSSMNELLDLIEKIYRIKDNLNVPIVIVGNKSDLANERNVSYQEGLELAKKYNTEYIETSAKNNTNVEQAFYALIRKIRDSKNRSVRRYKRKKCNIL